MIDTDKKQEFARADSPNESLLKSLSTYVDDERARLDAEKKMELKRIEDGKRLGLNTDKEMQRYRRIDEKDRELARIDPFKEEKKARGKRLEGLFDKSKGKSKTNLAHFCGVSTAAVALWVKNGAFSEDNAVKIANYLGVNLEWLMTGKGEQYALHTNRVIETTTDRFAVFDIQIHRGDKWRKISNQPAPVAFNKDFLGSEAIFADHCRLIRVQGDRMAPTINAGELLLINEDEKNIISGLFYLVSVNGEVLLSQIYRSAYGIRLHYHNTNYPDEEFINEKMAQVPVIGRVVMSVRQF